jgi:hypothetical protein
MNDFLFTKKKKMMVGVQEGCQEKGRGRKKRRADSLNFFSRK